jgi:hypothetical protein
MVNIQEISIENKSPNNLSGENQQNKVLTAKDCPQFESCSSPICPMFGSSGIWYPDEGICTSRNYSALPWIKRQRKIARKVRNKDFFFTYEMLNHNCIVTVATEGLDPDADFVDTETLVKRWLKKHSEKKPKTKEELELLRNRMSGIRQGLTTKKNDQSAEEIGTSDTNPSGVLEPNSSGQYESATQTIRS